MAANMAFANSSSRDTVAPIAPVLSYLAFINGLLAIFNAQEQAGPIPTYSFRITDNRTMGLAPRGQRAAAQFFNNRSLERLFEGFDSVKFFLTRDHLREVIVRR